MDQGTTSGAGQERGSTSSETKVALAAAVVVAAVLVTSTGSAVTGLGDAPESYLGAQSWSVLHAPGYPLYVVLSGVAIRVVPGAGDALVLNALSAATVLVSAAIVVLAARKIGASAVTSAIVGAGWATAASVWFYAGYAKHDALTTLWCATLLMVVIARVALGRRPGTVDLVVVGVLVGLSLGVGWAPVLSGCGGLLWWVAPRRAEWRRLGIGLAAVGLGVVIVGGLVLALTAVAPKTSWGGVDDLGSLVRLWSMDDFGLGSRVSGSESDPTQVARDASFGSDLVGYVAVVGRDMGPALAAAGVAGLVVLWRRGRRDLAAVLGLTVLGNVAASAFVLSVEPWGFRSGIVQGGFLAPTVLALAVAAAPALDAIVGWARRWVTPWVPLALAALLVVGPSVVTHRAPATQLRSDTARVYADHALSGLPPKTIVLAGTASSSFPLLARQTAGVRPDVTVIAVDGLGASWYRNQLADRHERIGPTSSSDHALDSIADLGVPIYADHAAQEALGERFGLRPVGLLAEVVTGAAPGAIAPEDPAALVELLDRQSRAAGMQSDPARTRWPNDELGWAYARPLLVMARNAIDAGDRELARDALETAAAIQPDRPVIRETLDDLAR